MSHAPADRALPHAAGRARWLLLAGLILVLAAAGWRFLAGGGPGHATARFRFRNDDGSEATASFAAAEGAAVHGVVRGLTARLRWAVRGPIAERSRLRVELGARSTSCADVSAWAPFPARGTGGDLELADARGLADREVTREVAGAFAPDGTDFLAGEVREYAPDLATPALDSGERTEVEIALAATPLAPPGAGYCLRLVDTGSPLPFVDGSVAQLAVDPTVARVTGARWADPGEPGAARPVPDAGAASGAAVAVTRLRPGEVARLAVSLTGTGGPSGPARRGVLELTRGEAIDRAVLLVDAARGVAYVSTYTKPAKLVRVELPGFVRTGELVLDGVEYVTAGVLDASRGLAYLTADQHPGKAIRVAVGPVGPLAVTGSVVAGEDVLPDRFAVPIRQTNLGTALLDPARGLAFFGTGYYDLAVLRATAAPEGPLRLALVRGFPEHSATSAAVLDPGQQAAFFGNEWSAPKGRIIRVDAAADRALSVTGALDLPPGDEHLSAAAIDAAAGVAYFGSGARVVQLDIGEGRLARLAVLDLGTAAAVASVAAVEPALDLGLFGAGPRVTLVRLSELAAAGTVEAAQGEGAFVAGAVDPRRFHAYLAVAGDPGRVVQVRLPEGVHLGVAYAPRRTTCAQARDWTEVKARAEANEPWRLAAAGAQVPDPGTGGAATTYPGLPGWVATGGTSAPREVAGLLEPTSAARGPYCFRVVERGGGDRLAGAHATLAEAFVE